MIIASGELIKGKPEVLHESAADPQHALPAAAVGPKPCRLRTAARCFPVSSCLQRGV